MTKARETKHIADTIYGYMQEAYDEGFEAGAKTAQECSWEKGVRDAWEFIKHNVDEYSGGVSLKEMRMVGFLHDLDPVMYTKEYVENRDREDAKKTEPIEVGDVVTCDDGEERMVIHIEKDGYVHTLNLEDYRDTLICMLGELKKTGKKAVIKVFKLLAVGELK